MKSLLTREERWPHEREERQHREAKKAERVHRRHVRHQRRRIETDGLEAALYEALLLHHERLRIISALRQRAMAMVTEELKQLRAEGRKPS